MGSKQHYFSTLFEECPKETADVTKKELNTLTTTHSSIYLLISLVFNFSLPHSGAKPHHSQTPWIRSMKVFGSLSNL